MTDNDLQVSLYAVHEPDVVDLAEHPRPDTVELGAGMINVGVEINGRRLPLGRFKADDILTADSDSQTTPSG